MTEARTLRRIAVFCGSNHGRLGAYREATVALGEELVRRGIGLVYGGGDVGLMGVVADTVLAGGGEVLGVIPQALYDLEVAHRGLSELRVVETMHERKRVMYGAADAVVALPGGIGTFEELFEAFTWTQLGFHDLRCGLLDVAGYYAPLVALLDGAVEAGFLRREHRAQLVAEDAPSRLLDRLAEPAPRLAKWSERQPPAPTSGGDPPDRDA